MYKSSLLLCSTLFFGQSFGQYAILKDKDGFINIREKPNAQSKIIDTLSSGKIVYCSDFDDVKGDWIPLDINTKGHLPLSGYVHKSRVQFISNFTKFEKAKINDTLFEFALDSIHISIKAGRFQQKGHIVKFEKDSKKVISIDNNRNPYGIDGWAPRKEYKLITIKYSAQKTDIEPKFWHDLFEPSFGYTEA